MNKCLKITVTVEPFDAALQPIIQKHARDFDLEGVVQAQGDGKLRIVVCGKKEQVDLFVDNLHKEATRAAIKDIEIEPHVRDKDYRGVFRVIE